MKSKVTPLPTPLNYFMANTISQCRVDEDEIEAQTSTLRKKLTAEANGNKTSSGRGLKTHQVHELAAAKIEESEKLRKALGIREDYEEGSHWKKQEERMREAIMEKGKEEGRREREDDDR